MLVLKVKYNGSWTELDLYGNESINFNKSVLEVQEFDKRSSDFTKQFRLPGTETNNVVMGNIFKINLEDSSFDPKQSLECAITISGQVLLVGSMRLEKIYVNVQKNDYEVVIYSQLGSLASSITEKTLCDLDFSEYTHSLTYSNIGNSWNLNLFGGDIVYPFIHYGYDDEDTIPDFEFTNTAYSFDQASNALQFWYYKPAIRVNKVIEKIINEAGYEMSSDYLTSDEFDKVYMPLSFSGELGVQTIEDISFYASLSTDDNIPDGEHNVVFDIEISDTSNNYNNITGEYTLTKEGRYSFKVDYTLSTNDCCEYEGDPYFHLYDRWVRDRSGNKTYFQDRFLGYQCNVSNVPFQKYITIDVGSSTSTSDWRVGDKIAFGTAKVVKDCNSYTLTSTHSTHTDFEYYECEDTTTPISLRVYTGSPVTICANPDIPPVITDGHPGTIVDNGPCASIHTCEATINFLSTFLLYDTPAEPGDGSDVVISENMNCDTTQLDFLKGIFTHFNMVVVPDPNDPIKLIIEPYVNWVNASDVEIRDWTNYLDTTKDVIVQPLVDNDNRYVKFTDAEDTDKLNKYNQENYNEVFGQYTYDSGSQIVQNTKEIETIFSPTPSEQLDGSSLMIVPKLYEEDDAGNLRPFASNPRLLFYNGMLDINDTYYVRDENDVVYSHNQYPCMSIVQDLNTPTPNKNVKTLSWTNVYNYYTQLAGYNSINAQGSYYELYWKDYFVDIYDSDSRIITAYFNIPFQEFLQVKLNDRIQISGLFGNTQWRINRIIDYDLTDPGMTKVELVKSLLIPTPVPVKRNYLIERCDVQQQNIASYYSVEPLTAGMGVQIDGFTDCFFVVEQTELDALVGITTTWNNCSDCEFGDTGNIYVLEDNGYLSLGYGWDGEQIWDVGSNTGLMTFNLDIHPADLSGTYCTPNLQFEVEIDGVLYQTPVGDLWNYRNSTNPYVFNVNKTSSIEYIKTRFIDTTLTNFKFGYQITHTEIGGTTPKRIYGQSLDNFALEINDVVYLGPNYPEYTMKLWKVIGKNSLATPDAQITEPFGNGIVNDMSFTAPSYLMTDYYGKWYSLGKMQYIFLLKYSINQGPSSSMEYSGVGQTTGTPYTFNARWKDANITGVDASGVSGIYQWANSPNWNNFGNGVVVKVEGITENVVISGYNGYTTSINNEIWRVI